MDHLTLKKRIMDYLDCIVGFKDIFYKAYKPRLFLIIYFKHTDNSISNFYITTPIYIY